MRRAPETFVGRPCRRGHRVRYVADERCVACRREALKKFYERAMAGRMPERWQLARKRAKARGAAFYSTGRPCLNGHMSRRRTSNGICLECKRYWRSHKSASQRAKDRKRQLAYNRRTARALRVLTHLGAPI
jgi:hypothetical protein